MASRPLTNPVTYGTAVGTEAMSNLDTSFGAVFTSGFNDSALGWVNYATDIGTANNYAVTLASAPSGYTAGMEVVLKVANTNTSSSTINVNALGTKAIVNPANLALSGGEMPVNSLTTLVYDGTSFRITGVCPAIRNLTSLSGNQTIDLAGYTSAAIQLAWTSGAASVTLTLQHVAQGVPIFLALQNTIGSTLTFLMAMTDPAGTAYTSIAAILPGAAGGNVPTSLISTGIGVFTGNSRILWGSPYASGSVLFGS